MAIEIGAQTDIGRRRAGNEDAFEVVPLAEGILCIVADGMGGHLAGEVASRLAVETIRERLSTAQSSGDPSAALEQAVQAANSAVLAAATADPSRHGMGTTVVCAALTDSRAVLANVGDSPAFLVRGGRAQQVTRDHSWVGEQVARGELSPAQAAVHPYRHMLTRALGLDEPLLVDTYGPLDLQAGDVLILCSDGLTEHVRADELPGLVDGLTAQAAAERLVALANERGGSDNITIVVARVG